MIIRKTIEVSLTEREIRTLDSAAEIMNELGKTLERNECTEIAQRIEDYTSARTFNIVI